MDAEPDATANDDSAAATGPRAAAAGPTLDKRGLLKRVVAATDLPAAQARKLLEVALAEIGTALDAGASLALPPLGKVKRVRTTDQGGIPVHTLRLRRSRAADPAEAEDDEGASPGAKARARVKPASPRGAAAAAAGTGAEDDDD